MLDFFRRPLGAWTLTLGAGALLFFLGLHTGRALRGPELARFQEDAVREAERASRLDALNRSLEQRLAGLEGQVKTLERETAGGVPLPVPPAKGQVRDQVVRLGEAVVLVGGQVILTVEEIRTAPARVKIRLKSPEGKEGVAVLKPGGQVNLKLPQGLFALVLQRVEPRAVTVAVVKR
ncbi:MAG: hypothetical protein KQJ78_08780 [Deltaproteobacteria bacterium]|nr:hypothetical protein [Deltaproteobacteria bacterium]